MPKFVVGITKQAFQCGERHARVLAHISERQDRRESNFRSWMIENSLQRGNGWLADLAQSKRATGWSAKRAWNLFALQRFDQSGNRGRSFGTHIPECIRSLPAFGRG